MNVQSPLGEYPKYLEQTVVLSDGREIFVRPVVPADARHLKEAADRADEETLYYRFFTPRPNLGPRRLAYLTELDYVWRLALVAVGPDGPVAIARYEGAPDSTEAEFAAVVDPDWRKLGISKILGEILAETAAKHGIRRFGAFYLADNVGARKMLDSLGFGRGEPESGVMTTYLDLA
jgi:GNAT superfamily N-acetyltransferase